MKISQLIDFQESISQKVMSNNEIEQITTSGNIWDICLLRIWIESRLVFFYDLWSQMVIDAMSGSFSIYCKQWHTLKYTAWSI